MNNTASPSGTAPEDAAAARRKRRVRWTIRLVVLLILIGYPVIFGLDCMFYYPDRTIYSSPEAFHLAYDDVRFRTDDGVELHGWLLKAPRNHRGTVLHFHGNAANITDHIFSTAWLPETGYNVFMFDYRGYGKSGGRVSREGTIRDGIAAVDYLLSRSDIDRNGIVAYGQSLGGAVAVAVAAERPEIRAVVAESTFESYRSIATNHLACQTGRWLASRIVRIAISNQHDPIDVVARIAPRPVFIIAGEYDRICFPENGRALFDAADEPKEFWLVPEGDHLQLQFAAGREHRDRILSFFDRAIGVQPRDTELP